MPIRTSISEALLNEKVMTLLHSRASCIDARSVMLELVEEASAACNWRIGHFDPGRGDRYKCKLALRSIHESIGAEYEMVGHS